MQRLLLLYTFLSCSILVVNSWVYQTGVCSCQTDDGTVDLSPLDSTSGSPRFKDVPDDTTANTFFSYNPCTPFTFKPEHACLNVTVCQRQGSGEYAAGSPGSSHFFENEDGLHITYSTTDGYNQVRTTDILLVCDTGRDRLDVLGETDVGSRRYEMRLVSKHSCPYQPPTTPTTMATTATTPPDTECDYWRHLTFFLVATLSLALLLAIAGLGCRVAHRKFHHGYSREITVSPQYKANVYDV